MKSSRRRLAGLAGAAVAAAVLSAAATPLGLSLAQSDDDDTAPAPASVGADVPLTYFGPAPSNAIIDPRDQALVGPVQLLRSGTVDQEAGTVTLPLYRGELRDGEPTWYILTDTTDKAASEALGLNFTGKLAYAATGRAVRDAELEQDATLVFSEGGVDFAPERIVVPGETPNLFPPAQAEPGSVGDDAYSPLVRITNVSGSPLYNAPVVAFGVEADAINFCTDDQPVDHALVHDAVVSICPDLDNPNGGGTVTLRLTPGFSFAKPILYLSLDANDTTAAAIEGVTFAPALQDVTVGRDDSAFSAVERLFAVVNGPTGAGNPQRQGLNSALGDEGVKGPLNLFGGIPTVATDYSPLWDFNLGEWTQEAIDNDYRSRMIDEFQYLGFVEGGFITGPGGAPFGSTGIIINCPVVLRFL